MFNYFEEKLVAASVLADEIKAIGCSPVEGEDDAERIGRAVQELAARLSAIGTSLITLALDQHSPAIPGKRLFGRRVH